MTAVVVGKGTRSSRAARVASTSLYSLVGSMRIGIFHAALPQPARKPGGVEVFVDRLARQLSRRGHDTQVLSFSEPTQDAPYRHVSLRPRRLERSSIGRLTIVPWLLNGIDVEGLDVLHLHGDDWFFFCRRVPTVRTFYGSAVWEAIRGGRLRYRARMAVVAPLEVLASSLATYACTAIPGHSRLYRPDATLPIGVDLPTSVVLERSHPPTILFIGTWGGRKRGMMLERVFREHVRPRIPGAELWMISDRCESRDPAVRWFAAPSDSDVVRMLRAAWAMCLPSRYEGFGMPYVEAMAQGTPVVATPNAGARYVLGQGKFGALVEDDELGETLVRLLADEEYRRQLAAAGRRRSQDFAWARIVDEHERAYEQAIERWDRRH
jgi:glycosyltransferase involved in cell wall biosynthesis